MNYNEAQVRALEVCIQKMQSGEKLEQTLELYPSWTAELTPPLEAVQVLRIYADSLPTWLPANSQAKADFLNAAQNLSRSKGSQTTRSSRLSRLAWLALILLLIAGALAGYAAAMIALPGEIFYPLKMFTWQARQQFALQPDHKLTLERAFDQARLEDLRSMVALGRSGSIKFAGLLAQGNLEDWHLAELPARLPEQAKIVGQVQDGIWVETSAMLGTDGILTIEQIQPREYVFEGQLQEITADSLVVSGIPVRLNQSTLVHGSPMAGSRVKIIAFRSADDSLQARLVEAAMPGNP
jgi:hypothetical protein